MTTGLSEDRFLFRDDSCIVLNKAYGEAMEGAGKGIVDLPLLLAASFGHGTSSKGMPFPPTAVHRLDVPVSGCALFARTPAALAFLNTCFAEGRARKVYWAVTEYPRNMNPIKEADELVHWISVDGRHNKSFAHSEEGPDRKQAVLRFRLLGKGNHYLFLEVELITGRHHQIRAQLAAQGLFIKGDLKYGARRSEPGGGIRLHARSLAFPNPMNPDSGTYIQTVAPVPKEDALWKAFEEASKV